MVYMIDGHNLIAKLPDITLDDPDDEAKLVQKLIGFCARTKQQCVVVFDYGLPGGVSRMSTRSVQVVFASARSNADRVIMERLKKVPDPRGWTVVTSDNDVATTARMCRMKTMHAEDFARLLERPPNKMVAVDAGEAADVKLSDDEVDEWMDLFGGKK
ncbi:MAG TPA: NYN domain-containing protein [Aggregatilineales bacterium]|nr:NYN domain-containing protein [Anaerolineae bacterium]HUN08771.1 NYN domain-containing protein [Aggregatilineales bacterium]